MGPHMGLNTRKPDGRVSDVGRVSDNMRFKPACSATETG